MVMMIESTNNDKVFFFHFCFKLVLKRLPLLIQKPILLFSLPQISITKNHKRGIRFFSWNYRNSIFSLEGKE